MRTRNSDQTYFVLHLEVGDERPASELAYEVQVLDAHGRARACGYLGASESELAVEGERVSPC